jgi:hypothetical protein
MSTNMLLIYGKLLPPEIFLAVVHKTTCACPFLTLYRTSSAKCLVAAGLKADWCGPQSTAACILPIVQSRPVFIGHPTLSHSKSSPMALCCSASCCEAVCDLASICYSLHHLVHYLGPGEWSIGIPSFATAMLCGIVACFASLEPQWLHQLLTALLILIFVSWGVPPGVPPCDGTWSVRMFSSQGHLCCRIVLLILKL